MLAAPTDPDGITRIEYTYDGCLVNEIDLSHLDLDDNEHWLYTPLQCSTESSIKDLYAWLKMEPELDIQNNKKYIDTRTFTRPKKRPMRISFESLFLGLPSYAKNIRRQNPDATHTEDSEDKEFVPPMLKLSAKTSMNVLSDETSMKSGQESMEAFLNMSQSKGIDSFINLGEPDFNDTLMNISQPSHFYASVTLPMNETTFNNDTTMTITNKDITTRQVLHDDTILSNKTYRVSSLNNTFCKESAHEDLKEIHNITVDKASAPPSNFDGEETDTATLSSTFVTECNADNNAQLPSVASSDVKTLDTTYLSSANNAGRQGTVSRVSYKPTIHVNNLELNTTCDISSNGIESATFLETQANDALDMSFTLPTYCQSTPIHSNVVNSMSKFATKYSDQPRQILYPAQKAPTSLRRELLAEIRRSSERNKLDTTYNHASDDHPDLRDIKEKIDACDGDIRSEVDVLPENRYHTYKKSTLATMPNECRNQYSERDVATTSVQKESAMNHKFYTFTKKSNNVEKLGENIETTAVENTGVNRPNMDGTFCKPFPSVPKRNANRRLSKLPQFLRKSNPNLVSLKTTTSMSGNPNVFGIGYIKGSQPNIAQNVEKPLPCKLHPFGKLKSGSEQRLLEANVNNANEFSTKGATGSTESIESTQSAHSAPDLDNRLSICSENSHDPCNRRTMNIEQLHQLVRMQEESLEQDLSPQLNRPILENTWVEEKTNLSPILRNGTEHGIIDTDSPLNADPSMKCSSPAISPIRSGHALNEGNSEDNVVKSKDEVAMVGKTEDLNQIVPKVENKTRLRQPTNWATGSKLSAVTSGIPRPASRIPALRFARPNSKIIQTDLRKGCT